MTYEQFLAHPLNGSTAFSSRGTRLLAAVFVTLSLADFALTYFLLNTPGDRYGEANGAALYVLTTCGWWGLAGYKLASVAAVLAASAYVGRQRPRAACVLVGAACAALGAVALYSTLLVVHRATDDETQRCIAIADQMQER